MRFRSQGATPGFGHHRFRDADRRSRALIELTADLGVPGHHLRALATLADAVEAAQGRPLTVNAAAAIAAVLGEAGIDARHFGPLAIATRAAGLAVQIVSQTAPTGSAVSSPVPCGSNRGVAGKPACLLQASRSDHERAKRNLPTQAANARRHKRAQLPTSRNHRPCDSAENRRFMHSSKSAPPAPQIDSARAPLPRCRGPNRYVWPAHDGARARSRNPTDGPPSSPLAQ